MAWTMHLPQGATCDGGAKGSGDRKPEKDISSYLVA